MPEGSHSPGDWGLAAEALACLILARGALGLASFARVAAWAAADEAGDRSVDPQAARRIGWAVDAAARRTPGGASCFAQGLAAQAMLRRRGLASRLYYGARSEGSRGPLAHVWVRSGDEDVVGAAGCERFALLATFPPLAGGVGLGKPPRND
jgi:hypothetical protein